DSVLCPAPSGPAAGKRPLTWGFYEGGRSLIEGRGAVQSDDAAGEVAPLRTLPARPAEQVGESRLVGPGADRLGEVDVGVRARGDRTGDGRQGAHQVLDVHGAERRP